MDIITRLYQINLTKKDYMHYACNNKITDDMFILIFDIIKNKDLDTEIINEVVPKLIMIEYFYTKYVQKKKIRMSTLLESYINNYHSNTILNKCTLIKIFINEHIKNLKYISTRNAIRIINMMINNNMNLNEIIIESKLLLKIVHTNKSLIYILSNIPKSILIENYKILLENLKIKNIKSISENKLNFIIKKLLELNINCLTKFLTDNKICNMPIVGNEESLLSYAYSKVRKINTPDTDALFKQICSMELNYKKIDVENFIGFLFRNDFPLYLISKFLNDNKETVMDLYKELVLWFTKQRFLYNNNLEYGTNSVYEILDKKIDKIIDSEEKIDLYNYTEKIISLSNLDIYISTFEKLLKININNFNINHINSFSNFKTLCDSITQYLIRQIMVYKIKINFESEYLKKIFDILPIKTITSLFFTLYNTLEPVIEIKTIKNIYEYIFTTRIHNKNQTQITNSRYLRITPKNNNSLNYSTNLTYSNFINESINERQSKFSNSNCPSGHYDDSRGQRSSRDSPSDSGDLARRYLSSILSYSSSSNINTSLTLSQSSQQSNIYNISEPDLKNIIDNSNDEINFEIYFEIYDKFRIFDFIEEHVLNNNDILHNQKDKNTYYDLLFQGVPSIYSRLSQKEEKKVNNYIVKKTKNLFELIKMYKLPYEKILINDDYELVIKIETSEIVTIFEYLKTAEFYSSKKAVLEGILIKLFINCISVMDLSEIKKIYYIMVQKNMDISLIKLSILESHTSKAITIFPDHYFDTVIDLLKSKNSGKSIKEIIKSPLIDYFKIDLRITLYLIEIFIQEKYQVDLSFHKIINLIKITKLKNPINHDIIFRLSNLNSCSIKKEFKEKIIRKLNKILLNSYFELDIPSYNLKYLDNEHHLILSSKLKNLYKNISGESCKKIKYFNYNDILNTLKEIYKIDKKDFDHPWKISFYNSPGDDAGGLSRDLSSNAIKEFIKYGYLIETSNGTYIFNDNDDAENDYVKKIIAEYMIKQTLLDKVPLSVTLDPSIIFYLSSMCDNFGRLHSKFDYDFLSKTLPENIKKNMQFEVYDNMYKYPQSKIISDIIIIDGNYYCIESCSKLGNFSNSVFKYHNLVSNKDLKKYISNLIRFNVWYILHKNILSYESMRQKILWIMKSHKIWSPYSLNNLLHGDLINIEDLLSKLDFFCNATKYYTDDIKKIYNTNYISNNITHLQHEKYKNIKIIKIDLTIKNIIFKEYISCTKDAIRELSNEYKDFYNKLLEFWYGTTVKNTEINPIITITNMGSIMNLSPIQASTCSFKMYIPLYSTSVELIDENEFNKNEPNILKSIIKKRLYDSVITGFDLLKKCNKGFSYS